MIKHGRLLVVKGAHVYDMSDLLSSVKWSGRKGSPARKLEAVFIDDDRLGQGRADIDVEDGQQCVFLWKNKELFRGMFMRQGQSRTKIKSVLAYDNGIRLSNNRDSFAYENVTASHVFVDVCKRFGIPTGEVVNTHHHIPELPKPRTTGWDAIADALTQTFEATGIRYYVMCIGEKLHLIERRRNILQWVIETGVNLENYSYTKSIEKIRTRINLLSRENYVLATAINHSLESRIGIFQDVVSVTDELNEAQLNERANTVLEENNKALETFSVSVPFGKTDIVAGVGVYIVLNPLDMEQTFYVEQDTHTFSGREHTMSLSLCATLDFSR